MLDCQEDITQVYEQPLCERVRLFLRLELIFKQAADHAEASNQYETQMCLNAIFALLNLTHRYELRLEVLKELERIRSLLLQSQEDEDVHRSHVQTILKELDSCTKDLHQLDLKYIDRIRNVEFLNVIKQRNIHDTGSYLFEIPELQYWLLQPSSHRSHQVKKWLSDFASFEKSIAFLLRLIRSSADAFEIEADKGIYLKTIDDRKKNYQLLRVEVLSPQNVYPRISGSRHRFAIRFMSQICANEKPVQTSEKVKFNLQICSI